jgi:hypothetical protein
MKRSGIREFNHIPPWTAMDGGNAIGLQEQSMQLADKLIFFFASFA